MQKKIKNKNKNKNKKYRMFRDYRWSHGPGRYGSCHCRSHTSQHRGPRCPRFRASDRTRVTGLRKSLAPSLGAFDEATGLDNQRGNASEPIKSFPRYSSKVFTISKQDSILERSI